MNSSPRLVVRTYAPLQRYLVIGGVLLATLIALYAAFEWGRRNAGFDGLKARGEVGDLRGQLRDVEAEARRLRLTLAAQETERGGQVRERAELARTIGDLQAEVARQAQDLAFYRGVVGDNAQAEVMKIQQFSVTAGKEPGHFHLRLVLGRPLRPEDAVSGTVQMSFEGTTAATPVTLDLAAVSDVPGGILNFNYRYVETLEQDIRLPAGFAPARTTIELQPARKGANRIRQTFLWTVESA
jgi:hypothetical protein